MSERMKEVLFYTGITLFALGIVVLLYNFIEK